MQVVVERQPGSQVTITVTVEPAIIEQQMEQLFQKRARRVTIPGFRPGKAPRRMIEERIPKAMLLEEAVEDVINSTYREALKEQNIQPLEQGDLSDSKITEDLTLTYSVRVAVRPEITLPPYTGLEVHHTATQVTKEQVETEITRLQERSSDFNEVVDEGIQTGDYVTVDYTMTVDGEPYPEGDTTGYPLEIGSDTFFPELNEGLIGVKQGETATVTTTYPDDYSNKDLAGKKAEFEIIVQQVRRMIKPTADDAWAQYISSGSLQTLEELRERIRHNLQVLAEQNDRDQIRENLVRQLVDKAELDVPEIMVEDEFEHLMHDMEHRLSHERMSLEEYAEMIDRNVDDIRADRRLQAKSFVRRSLVLGEIARREEINADEEDVLAVLMSAGRDEAAAKDEIKQMQKSGQLDQAISRLFHEKVLSFLEANAKIEIEGAPEKTATSDQENPE